MGAGLLANAVDQSTPLLTDPPPSRASPLPHWVSVPTEKSSSCAVAYSYAGIRWLVRLDGRL
ncbi:hypothetical protein CEC48_07155 [Pseudomonas sp. K2I15]|nr:hypothetical protein CEC48_07155 [Pseudomonas sp. K2I15]